MAKRTKSSAGNQMTGAVRLNKFLSDAGVCSRREADKYIEEGKVLVDGEPAVIGMTVSDDQEVIFCKKPVQRQRDLVLIAFHKPRGIVCTTDKQEPDNIIDYINYGKRIFPIGRLDKDSEGLILLTNDGEIVNKILRAGNHHEKEYIVRVNKPITDTFLEGMRSGVPILNTVTKPCRIQTEGKDTFRIILTQGLNRQIRRMCEYFGYKVLDLQRIRIMNIRLGRLYEGAYRNVTDQELSELLGRIENSTNAVASNADSTSAFVSNAVPMNGKLPKANFTKAGVKDKQGRSGEKTSVKGKQGRYNDKTSVKNKQGQYSEKTGGKGKQSQYSDKTSVKDKQGQYSDKTSVKNKNFDKPSAKGKQGQYIDKTSGKGKQGQYVDKPSVKGKQGQYVDKPSVKGKQGQYIDKSSAKDKQGRHPDKSRLKGFDRKGQRFKSEKGSAN